MALQTDGTRYQKLLQDRAEARKRELDLEVEILVCEKQMELAALVAGGSATAADLHSEIEQFIEKHRDQMEPYDFEFLKEEYRTVSEVAAHLEISTSSVRRLERSGEITRRQYPGKVIQLSSLSVVRYVINGKSEEAP